MWDLLISTTWLYTFLIGGTRKTKRNSVLSDSWQPGFPRRPLLANGFWFFNTQEIECVPLPYSHISNKYTLLSDPAGFWVCIAGESNLHLMGWRNGWVLYGFVTVVRQFQCLSPIIMLLDLSLSIIVCATDIRFEFWRLRPMHAYKNALTNLLQWL